MFLPDWQADTGIHARRSNNTRRTWIMDDPAPDHDMGVDEGKIFIAIETRQEVKDALLEYLELGTDALPVEVPEPPRNAPAPPTGPGRPVMPSTGTKRSRRS